MRRCREECRLAEVLLYCETDMQQARQQKYQRNTRGSVNMLIKLMGGKVNVEEERRRKERAERRRFLCAVEREGEGWGRSWLLSGNLGVARRVWSVG